MTMVLLGQWVRILPMMLLVMSTIEEARHLGWRFDIVKDEASADGLQLMAELRLMWY